MSATNFTERTMLSRDRATACLEAAWEIDALARMLPGQVALDHNAEHMVVRAVSARLHSLASILMSAIDESEDEVPTKVLQKKLFLAAAREG